MVTERLQSVILVVFPARPVIHTVPGIVDPRLPGRARPLGVTVTLSEQSASLLRGAGFADVRVIWPAIFPDRWPRRPRAHGPATVLFAGHHDAGGGADGAIAAAAEARRCGARFRLVLALRDRPGEDRRALTALLAAHARQQGIGDTLIRGHVTDMPGLLAAADVLLFIPDVLAGKADIPLVVLEALATGRPVVISNLPQFAPLTGAALPVPAGDARAAGRLLADLLARPRWWEAVAERGCALAASRFGPARFTAEYRRLYRELSG